MNALIPKPFGLKDSSGNDVFEEKVKSKIGITEIFIDDWVYHHEYGDIHCATNATRTPPSTNWW